VSEHATRNTDGAESPLDEAAVRCELPPGPRLPLVGQSLAILFATDRYATYLRSRFQSMATVKVAGIGRIVTVWDPSLIKQLLGGDPNVVRGGEASAQFLLAPAGPSSVIVLDGADHLRTRKLLLPPFHGEAVNRYERLIAELAAVEVDTWQIGESVATRLRMQAITIEVMLHAVIGVRDPQRLERMRRVLARVADASLLAFGLEAKYPGLANNELGRRLPWIRARFEADVLLYEEIADHRANPEGREDVLAMLIAAETEEAPFSDQELRDQISTLLVAGAETTATALSWCFERLVRHPDVLARAQNELLGENAGRYLDAIVSETLRVRPVIDGAARKLAAPFKLGGYELPAGTFISVSIAGVQLSDAFENPDEFQPERFLEQPPAPFTFIPFGGSTHRCIGASFAAMEMRTILRVVLQRVHLKQPTRPSERSVRWRRITTTPSHDGRVRVSART
jgi:cytochrome P450 family 135